MIELRADVELKDTIMVDMPKLAREGFYTCIIHIEYEWKSLSGNKKKDAESRKEVSNLNPFDVLNLVKNDIDLGTNRGTLNLVSKEANSSGYSFWNVGSSSSTTTLIVEKIDKIERLIIDGKLSFVDDQGKPLENIDYLGDNEMARDEVEPVDNEMASFLASKRVGYGTNSLLE
ncbi:hypothetical protein Tco_1436641 [Tanacetum coccineum]